MRYLPILLSLFTGACLAAPASPPQTTVPRAFQGEWNMRPADCGSALNDSLLRLRSGQIEYYESAGPLRAAVARGRELALIAELRGEGETRLHVAQFRLSRDGRTLTEVGGTPPLVRYRCPARRR